MSHTDNKQGTLIRFYVLDPSAVFDIVIASSFKKCVKLKWKH